MPKIAFPNPDLTVSYQKLKERNLLDPSYVAKVDAMPQPKCGPVLPHGPAPKCIGWSIDGYVTQAPVVHLNGVSRTTSAKLAQAGLTTIGDMLATKSDFSGPSFSDRVRRILRRVKAGVQNARLAEFLAQT